MAVIRIQEQHGGPNGANAAVSFDDGPPYPVIVNDPFSQEEGKEKALEWYFEEYLTFPFTKGVKARQAAASLTTYGEALFGQVFAHRDAYTDYRDIVKAGLSTLSIEIVGSPQFHGLHWEALKDPNLPRPLALEATMVRKNRNPAAVKVSVRASPTINVLLVAARPFGKRDMGYRTISRPLVETLRQANMFVQVDLVRPGTYKALENRVREVTAQRGVGYYHLIHFDVHGSVLSHQQVEEGQEAK